MLKRAFTSKKDDNDELADNLETVQDVESAIISAISVLNDLLNYDKVNITINKLFCFLMLSLLTYYLLIV